MGRIAGEQDPPPGIAMRLSYGSETAWVRNIVERDLRQVAAECDRASATRSESGELGRR